MTCLHVSWPCSACGFGAENPQLYLAALREKASVAELREQLASARRDLAESEELRAAVVSAAADAAGVTAAVLRKLQIAQPVVDAAYALCAAVERGVGDAEGTLVADELRATVERHRRGAPS